MIMNRPCMSPTWACPPRTPLSLRTGSVRPGRCDGLQFCHERSTRQNSNRISSVKSILSVLNFTILAMLAAKGSDLRRVFSIRESSDCSSAPPSVQLPTLSQPDMRLNSHAGLRHGSQPEIHLGAHHHGSIWWITCLRAPARDTYY
jgi:hypothetical protein